MKSKKTITSLKNTALWLPRLDWLKLEILLPPLSKQNTAQGGKL
jgi:hypothetical protein